MQQRSSGGPRLRSYRATAWLAFVPTFLFYAWSAQRTVQFWDVGEMQTVPWILGIAHPTTFPLYTLLGWLFAHALAVGSVAWRLSVFSAVAACATGWLVYRIVRDEADAPWLGLGCCWLYESTTLVWSRGTRADVHPLAAACSVAAFWAMLRWRRTRRAPYFVGGLGALGAGLAVHPVALFTIPAVVVLAAVATRAPARRTLALGAVALVAPLAAYAYVPLRSLQLGAERRDPTLALGLPPGAPFWNYGPASTVRGFLWMVSGAQFRRAAGLDGYRDPAAFAHGFALAHGLVAAQFAPVLLAVACVGLATYARRDAAVLAAFALQAIAAVPFAFAYLEETDQDRYLLAALAIVAALVGIGAARLARAIAALDGRLRIRPVAAVLAATLAGFAIAAFYRNVNVIAVDRDDLGRRYVDDVVARTPPRAILVADWTYATPLAYAAFVQHRLGDRIVVTGPVQAFAGYLAAWLARRPVVYVEGAPAPVALGPQLRSRPLNATLPYLFAVSDAASGLPATGR